MPRPAEPCVFCAQRNLTWLDDGRPVCGPHFLESQGQPANPPPGRGESLRRRLRLSPGAERLLREAAE